MYLYFRSASGHISEPIEGIPATLETVRGMNNDNLKRYGTFFLSEEKITDEDRAATLAYESAREVARLKMANEELERRLNKKPVSARIKEHFRRKK